MITRLRECFIDIAREGGEKKINKKFRESNRMLNGKVKESSGVHHW